MAANWTRQLPWTDGSGRLSPLKLGLFLAMLAPAVILLGRALGDDLGARPLDEAIHVSGSWGVRILVAALLVTPIRRITGWNRLAGARRMIGLGALAWVLLHVSLYVIDQDFALGTVASEIVLRIYLAIGFAALLILVALGLTSFDAAIRRMGARNWQRLHRLAYAAGILGSVHFFLQSKLNVTEPAVMAALFLLGMGVRGIDRWTRGVPDWRLLLPLGLVVTLATAAIEAGWYAVLTGVPAERVLEANLSLAAGLRPAHWALIATLVAIALSLAAPRLKRWRKSRRRSAGAVAVRVA
ncbi:MAG: protein-methionine-sulfoxide reductase heme-binding subunit MsrQ [Azospirillaceae bacterium]